MAKTVAKKDDRPEPTPAAPQRDVKNPRTLDDLFDRLDNVSRLRATLEDFGLATPKLMKDVDEVQAELSTQIGGQMKYDPGRTPIIIRHTNKNTGTTQLFSYTSEDDQPWFDSVEIKESSEIFLDAGTGTPPSGGGDPSTGTGAAGDGSTTTPPTPTPTPTPPPTTTDAGGTDAGTGTADPEAPFPTEGQGQDDGTDTGTDAGTQQPA